jgi:hypothetical protein
MNGSITRPWPQPLGDAAYNGVLGDIVRTIEPQTEADPAAILVQMHALFGNVIGRTPHFRVGADVHHMNLFVGIVGDTSKARKGVSGGQARRIFETVDEDWTKNSITSGASSGEGLIWAVRDAIEKQQAIKEGGRVVDYQIVTEDPGVVDKRLVVIEPELASTLKVMAREGNTFSPVVRQAWDGQDLRTLTKGSPARATAPHISFIGHITSQELTRYLEATEAANGFGNRFLWICCRRSKELPDGGQPVDLEKLMRRLSAAVDHARRTGELRRDAEAGRRWHHVYGRLSAGRPGMLGAMTGRAEAQVMRLACLYAVADMSSVVKLEHLNAALEVWRYAFDSAMYLFGDRLGDATADAILMYLKAHYPASVTRSEISRDLFARNKPASDIDRALAVLIDDYKLARTDRDRTGKGRPADLFYYSQADDVNDLYDRTAEPAPPSVVNVVSVVARGDQDAASGIF